MTVDQQYKRLVESVLKDGEEREDRTGTGTFSLFGENAKYDLREGFPILTTKKVNFKAVVDELFWFLRGETNIKTLKSPQIWKPWAGEGGECGPIYGFQWRNWLCPGEYYDDPYRVDQIENLIYNIKTSPFSRRHLISAWNIADLDKMALPPCHVMANFYVAKDGWLDCKLYQRSADLAIGVPFNIASYALLTHLIALECGYKPRFLYHSFGDLHIYQNHIQGLKEQIKREPHPQPQLYIEPGCDDSLFSLIKDEDRVHLLDYKYHPFIKYPVAV